MMHHTLDTIFSKIIFFHLLLLSLINWALDFEKSRASLILRKIFWVSLDQTQTASLIVIAQKDWNLSQDFV